MADDRVRVVVRTPSLRPTVADDADLWVEGFLSRFPLFGGIVLIISVAVIALIYAIMATPVVLGPYIE